MKTDIRKASRQDIPALCEIWKACFADTDEYISCFYKANFDRIEVTVYTVDNKPVSMVHLMDAEFVNGGKCQKAKYMYAGGTLPQHRKQGCLAAILEHEKKRAEETGVALFFKPVSPSLTDYFSRLDFEIDAYFSLLTVQPEKALPLSVCDLSYMEYNRMRNAAFAGIPYARWQDEHLRWCVEENGYFSGRTLGIELDGKDYFLMGYPEDDVLIINETNLLAAQLRQISGALCSLFGTALIKAYMPENYDEGEKIISSFVYNTALCKTYVNLILI